MVYSLQPIYHLSKRACCTAHAGHARCALIVSRVLLPCQCRCTPGMTSNTSPIGTCIQVLCTGVNDLCGWADEQNALHACNLWRALFAGRPLQSPVAHSPSGSRQRRQRQQTTQQSSGWLKRSLKNVQGSTCSTNASGAFTKRLAQRRRQRRSGAGRRQWRPGPGG